MAVVKPIRVLVSLVIAVLIFGSLSNPVQAAGTATPMFLSFEADDALGAEVAKASSPGHLLGSWQADKGATTAIATTPPSPNAGQTLVFTKAANADVWSGFTLFDGGASTIYTDTTHPVITMDYYSSSATDTPVELKLEVVGNLNPAKPAYKVIKATPGWNSLSFDMSSGAKGWSGTARYNRVALLPNYGGDQPLAGVNAEANYGQKYYIDNVSVNGGTITDVQTGGPAPEPSATALANKVFLSFEPGDGNGANAVSTDAGLGAFEGATVEIANVPTTSGHSGKGAKFTKVKSGQPWSGFKAIYGADAFRYTSAEHSIISFDYHASVASPVQVKLETANKDSVVLTKSASQGWNSLSFDMSTASGWSDKVAFNLVAIFPDFSDSPDFAGAIVPANDQVFYIDNVSINGGTLADVGTQPTPTATPTATSPGLSCDPGTPAIRLLSPLTSEMNFKPTGYEGVLEYLTPGTIVGTHYFPLRSTVSIKYQALDSECKPVPAGTKVFLAVNAAYSRAKTSFINTYLGAVNLIAPIPPDCAADQYCGEGQTVLEQTTDEKGQVTFVLTNLNPISPQGKPQSQLTLPQGTLLMQSVFSPSFSNYKFDPFSGKATGAGASNLENHEAIDVIWPNYVNGMGSISQPNDAIVTPGTSKTLVYVVRDNLGNPVPNASVTITTDDGGTLVTPNSANAQADINGFKKVSATADSQGRVTVVAKSSKRSVQTILVTYDGFANADPAVTATNGYNTITWGIAQTVGAIKPNSVAKGKSIILPSVTNKKIAIRWSTSTKLICKVVSSKGVTKLTGLKKGICALTAANAGKGNILKLSQNAVVTIK